MTRAQECLGHNIHEITITTTLPLLLLVIIIRMMMLFFLLAGFSPTVCTDRRATSSAPFTGNGPFFFAPQVRIYSLLAHSCPDLPAAPGRVTVQLPLPPLRGSHMQDVNMWLCQINVARNLKAEVTLSLFDFENLCTFELPWPLTVYRAFGSHGHSAELRIERELYLYRRNLSR